MKKLLLVFLSIFLLGVDGAFAQSQVEAGWAPNHPLYGLEIALDKISLAIERNDREKAIKGLEIARERLAEVKAMLESNKLDDAVIAQRHHAEFLRGVSTSIPKIKSADSPKYINGLEMYRDIVGIEQEIEDQRTEVEFIRDDIKIKIKAKGGITPNQQTMIDNILANLDANTKWVKINIDNKKGEIKIKIKSETGKSESEVENELEAIEEAEERLHKGKISEEQFNSLVSSVNRWDSKLKDTALRNAEGMIFTISIRGQEGKYTVKIVGGKLVLCPNCQGGNTILVDPEDVEDVVEAVEERDIKDMTKLAMKYL